jgi:hypothetical protein
VVLVISVKSDDDEESGIERQSSKGEREEQRAECSKIRAVITQLLQEFNSAENNVEAVIFRVKHFKSEWNKNLCGCRTVHYRI